MPLRGPRRGPLRARYFRDLAAEVGPRTLQPDGLANASAAGSFALNGRINPDGLANASVLGAFAVNGMVALDGAVNSSAFGAHALQARLDFAGAMNAQAFGVHGLGGTVAPDGLKNASAAGSFALNGTVAPEGLAGSQAFGTPQVGELAQHEVAPDGLVNLQGFGLCRVGELALPGGGRWLGRPAVAHVRLAFGHMRGHENTQAFGVPSIGAVVVRMRQGRQRRQLAQLEALRLAA